MKGLSTRQFCILPFNGNSFSLSNPTLPESIPYSILTKHSNNSKSYVANTKPSAIFEANAAVFSFVGRRKTNAYIVQMLEIHKCWEYLTIFFSFFFFFSDKTNYLLLAYQSLRKALKKPEEIRNNINQKQHSQLRELHWA